MHKFLEQIYQNNGNYQGIIFLDRDGTIGKDVNYLRRKRQIKILPKVIEGIRLLNQNNIAVIVITNQPAVARGLITIEALRKLNDSLVEKLKSENVYIDAIFSCPHHPEKEHSDIPQDAMKYRIKCKCRKPGIAMHEKAMSIYGSSKIIGVIGDQTKDILAAKNLGTTGIIVKTGSKGEDGVHDVAADFVCDNFLDAVRRLL